MEGVGFKFPVGRTHKFLLRRNRALSEGAPDRGGCRVAACHLVVTK